MDNWNLSVPKVAHFYWGGNKLVYLRYLTIKTFMRLNPDWQIILWHPVIPFKGKSWGIEKGYSELDQNLCKDYLPDLLALPITKVPVDFNMLRFKNITAEVHKADYIRINALYLYGGLWSDMDILYFKPISEMSCNTLENQNKEVFVCISDYGHSTGFNLATENSHFFDILVNNLNKTFKQRDYQCWGPDIFNRYFKKLEFIPNAINLDMDTVYAHNCHQVKELLNGDPPRFTKNSIGCHWYAGNSVWGDFLNKTKGGETNLPDSIIGKLIKDAQ
jgi:mannosyltransferase OCH1-like enzyme